MYEAFSAFVMSEHMQGKTFEPATSAAGYQRMLTPHRKPYATSDGYVCVLPYNDKHWGKFFTLIGQPELANDVRFRTKALAQQISMRYMPSLPKRSKRALPTTGLKRSKMRTSQ